MDGSQAIAAGAALSVFSLDAQHDRLMRLDFPRSDGPATVLLPNRLRAHEEVSRCFRIDVELLSDDARISAGSTTLLNVIRRSTTLKG